MHELSQITTNAPRVPAADCSAAAADHVAGFVVGVYFFCLGTNITFSGTTLLKCLTKISETLKMNAFYNSSRV